MFLNGGTPQINPNHPSHRLQNREFTMINPQDKNYQNITILATPSNSIAHLHPFTTFEFTTGRSLLRNQTSGNIKNLPSIYHIGIHYRKVTWGVSSRGSPSNRWLIFWKIPSFEMDDDWGYPHDSGNLLVNVYITMENHPFSMGQSTLSTAILKFAKS